MATKDEIERIRPKSDLSGEFQVLALDHEHDTDLAVIRRVYELDPVHFGKTTTNLHHYKFVFALEERMHAMGFPEYYFNVRADDKKWQSTVEGWGAERTTDYDEVRYKRIL